MSVLNELLSTLPFMTEARAALVINAFWPMVKSRLFIFDSAGHRFFFLGLIIAVGVALLRVVPAGGWLHKLALLLVKFYVSAIRGTPMLVQLMIVFYGLPAIGIRLDPLPTAIVGFSLNIGAYASETIRAAILSVPKGQWKPTFPSA